MDVCKKATAGTMESSDVYVEITPGEGKIDVQVESIVKAQFGEAIYKTVLDVLRELQVNSASVRIMDQGALECVIRARVETAVLRGKGDN